MNTRLIVLLSCLWLSSNVLGQNNSSEIDPASKAEMEGQIEELNDGMKGFGKFINEFIDFELFKHTFETRRSTKNQMLRDTITQFYDRGGVDVMAKGKLNIDEFWPKILNRRKYFSPITGKTSTELSNDVYGILIDVQFDTLSSGRDQYKVSVKAEPALKLSTFLNQKGLSTEYQTKIDDHFKPLTEKQYSSPSEAPVPEYIAGLFTYLDEALQPYYNEIRSLSNTLDAGLAYNLNGATENQKIVFKAFSGQEYGFDDFAETNFLFPDNYSKAQTKDEHTYVINNKSIEQSQTDYVNAEIIGDFDPKQIHFTLDNEKIEGSISLKGNVFKVPISNLTATKAPHFLVAYYQDSLAVGVLQVYAYQITSLTLELTNVNTAASALDASKIQDALNTIYKPAVVQWSVSSSTLNIDPSEFDGKVIIEDPDQRSLISSGMRAVHKAFDGRQQSDFRIYLVNELEGQDRGKTILGYFPQNKAFGFVSAQQSEQSLSHTIAHELLHSRANLLHPWVHYQIEPESTNLLLDYGDGNNKALIKTYWDKLHNPKRIPNYKLDVEDGLKISELIGTYVNVEEIALNSAFILPSGEPIFIKNALEVAFNEEGAVGSFKDNEERYWLAAINTDKDEQFLGYIRKDLKNEAKNKEYVEKNRYQKLEKVLQYGTNIYAHAKQQRNNNYLDCIIKYQWNSDRITSSNIYSGSKDKIFIPSDAESKKISGSDCLYPLEDQVINGFGKAIYLGLVEHFDQTREQEIVDFANKISDELQDQKCALFSDEIPFEESLSGFAMPSVIKLLKEKEITTYKAFRTYFKYKFSSRDFKIVYSTDSLWLDIPKDYNTKSIDHVARINNKQSPYIYSYRDLYYRNLIMNGSYEFNKTAIRDIEKAQLAEPISNVDFHAQYKAKYATNSAFFFIAEWSARWGEDATKAYAGYIAVATGAGYKSGQILKDASIGALTDFALQAAIQYVFIAEDDASWIDILNAVDFTQVTASAFENSFTSIISNRKSELAVSAGISCIFDGNFEKGQLRESFSTASCAKGILSAVLASKISNYGLKKLKDIPFDKLVNGLKKLNISPNKWAEIFEFLNVKPSYVNLVKKYGQYSQILELPLSSIKFIDSKNWSDDVLKRLNGDLDNIDLKKAFVKDEGLMEAWRTIFQDEFLRKKPDKLAKVKIYAADFGKSFDDISNEFANIPSSHRLGWVDHLEFRTKSNGGVIKAGGQSSKYGSYADNSSVPSKYSSDNRFDDLAADPAVRNTSPKTRQEAMAGLEAESQGILSSPIIREPSGNMEFFDGNGSPWDVKGPRGGNFFNVDQVGASIRKELRDKGSFPNRRTGVPEPRKVLLDCTYIDGSELSSLRSWLQNNLDASELDRIKEINSSLF